MIHLCRLTLQQQRISTNREQLREYATKMISLLDSNTGIVNEKGLEVFGFQHLSFQEYFVAQSMVKGSDIDQVAKRMLSFTLNPRFRESLLLAFGWISWKWSSDKYNEFCKFLVTQTENDTIPFGILLFFDAINDMYQMPSNLVIFIALNNLINHRCDVIRNTYFISNLSKLPEKIVIEWMELYLKDDKYFRKFCQSFPLTDTTTYNNTSDAILKRIPSFIYRQLWSFHQRNSSKEFRINQILRKALILDDESDQIFNKDLSLCCLSHNIHASSIHPLVLSVIVALCGGIYVMKNQEDMINIDFSLKQMSRESSVIGPIIQYLSNTEESHSVKVQTLILEYESILQKSSTSDNSTAIVDTFIALICLQGLSQPLNYQKYSEYRALALALKRLKQTWFYLKKLCYPNECPNRFTVDVSSIISQTDLILKVFSSQHCEFNQQCMSFSVACASAWKKLGLWHESNQHSIVGFSSSNRAGRYFHCQPDFLHFIGEKELEQVAKKNRSLSIALLFLPQSLQLLYYYMLNSSADNNRNSILPVILLSECLIRLEVVDKYDLNFDLALPILQPILKEYMLENYGIVLKREIYSDSELQSNDRQKFWKAMIKHGLLESFKNQPKDVKTFINIERQRIRDSKAKLQNEEKDIQLFTVSISLARLFQSRYRSRKHPIIPMISINLDESEEICFAITNISDPVLRIIALSIILEMKDPMIFDEEQRDYLQWEMINLLQSLFPSFSLLMSTLLFVRCYAVRQFFPTSFQCMAKIIGERLNESTANLQDQEQEAVYIALQQLDNSDLFNYLSEFTKKKKNLSDLLHFNSTIFYHYFTNTTSFNTLNTILLSSMYLVEIGFDAQILKKYCQNDEQNNVSPIKELEQIWNEASKTKKIMTLKVATYITNYLEIWSKNEIEQIIEDISHCQLIERKALSEVQKWLDYHIDEKLRFLAYYAALQLVSGGSDISNLMKIIEEMFLIDKKFRLASIVANVISSPVVDLLILQQILPILQQNTSLSSKICTWINRKETLEMILNLEYNQITSNIVQSSEMLTKPFLLIIRVYSSDLLNYLNEYIRTFVDKEIEYVAVVIKWIIESSVWYQTKTKFSVQLFQYIFELLHNYQFPRIQKTIVNAMNSVFIHPEARKENIFIQEDAIINLERLICLWNTYSDDIVSICLLAYGNYLLKLEKFRLNRNISGEMKNMLTILFEASLSEIISIRAGFCLIFAEDSVINVNTISTWFANKWNITPIKKYKILLQQTLFDIKGESITSRKWQVSNYLRTNSTEVIETFVIELYNYLCRNDNNNHYLSDPESNYLKIAVIINERNWKEFRDVIQKNFPDEIEFKKRLYLHFKNNPIDRKASLELYSFFGTVTDEFVDMLEWFEEDEYREISFILANIKHISGRDVIDKLFNVINFKISNGKQFKSCLQVVRSFLEINAITMLELHQRFSHINNMLHNNNDEDILKLLTDFSCFKTDLLLSSRNKLYDENDIEQEFLRESKDFDKNSSLLLQTHFFS